MTIQIVDPKPCVCEENKICTDEVLTFYQEEYTECYKVNPTALCCKYCPGLKTCKEPCDGIFVDENHAE